MTIMSRWVTTIINNKGLYECLRPTIFAPKCDCILSNCLWVWEKERVLGKIARMGGDLLRIEPSIIEDNARKPLVWYMLKEGGFIPFMEVLNGYGESCSLQFVNSWEDRRVTINGILFRISEEVISLAMRLTMRGRKWKKVTRVVDEASLNCFFLEGEEPIHHRGGFMREKLPEPWNEVCLVLMKYLNA